MPVPFIIGIAAIVGAGWAGWYLGEKKKEKDSSFAPRCDYINAHGFLFPIETDHLLEKDEEKTLVDALEQYPKAVVERLNKGRKGEPPLKIVVAPSQNWHQFAPSAIDYLAIKFHRWHLGEHYRGHYFFPDNVLYLNVALKRYTVHGTGSLREIIPRHELAHAVDDFAVTDKTLVWELAGASDNFFKTPFLEELEEDSELCQFIFESQGHVLGRTASFQHELFAGALSLYVYYRYPEERNEWMPDDLKQGEGATLFQSIKEFLTLSRRFLNGDFSLPRIPFFPLFFHRVEDAQFVDQPGGGEVILQK